MHIFDKSFDVYNFCRIFFKFHIIFEIFVAAKATSVKVTSLADFALITQAIVKRI